MPVPADDLARTLARTASETAPHIGIVGDTYTLLLTGADTAGQFCLIDMHIPPGGGPPPHRHAFEETFTLLAGELQATFRGQTSTVRAGETLHIPANAPHQFHNGGAQPCRCLCICAPAGQENMFLELGVPLPTRTTAPPPLSEADQKAFMTKAQSLAAKYKTELLPHA
jgi:quercetin dioxygenase-like cupin family protein